MRTIINSILHRCAGQLIGCETHSRPSSYLAVQSHEKGKHLSKGIAHADDDAPPPYPEGLQRLPDDVVLYMSNFLDEVSLVCLTFVSTRFRRLVRAVESRAVRCVRWRVQCLLEQDLIRSMLARDTLLTMPDRLACNFCKCLHPLKDFGVRGKNGGYGIETLRLVPRVHPEARYCWRHIRKRLNYSSDNGSLHLEKSTIETPSEERWVEIYEATCLHCGTRLTGDAHVGYACSVCHEECSICHLAFLRSFKRQGPQRPLESHTKIRFKRRRCTGYTLEIRDLNGIQRDPLPPESSTWFERSPMFESAEHSLVSGCLVPRKYRRFPLYSPVECWKPQPGDSIITVRWKTPQMRPLVSFSLCIVQNFIPRKSALSSDPIQIKGIHRARESLL